MKAKLTAELNGNIQHFDTVHSRIHIVDYTEKTCSARGVEVSGVKPDGIDSLELLNVEKHPITVSVFDNHCFTDESGKDIAHCEAVVYPSNSVSGSWILFVEIKDCKPKNISEYFEKAKLQIIETVKTFRNRQFIASTKKVHTVISFPQRNKTDFYHQLIKQSDRQKFLHQHRIIIKASNSLTVKNEKIIV